MASFRLSVAARSSRMSMRALIPAALVIASTLQGCASLSAMQRPVVSKDLGQVVCPTDVEVQKFYGLQAVARGEYRDRIISGCLKAINSNYQAFKLAVHNESASTRLTSGILAVGTSAIGSFARADVARRLAAGNAFVLGTSATIDKDIFFQQTLPALESTMDANRERVLQRIVAAQKQDPEGKTYSLVDAGNDLDAYQNAGNLYAAVSELTKTAAAAAQEEEQKRVDLQSGVIDLGTYVPVSPFIRPRYLALRARVSGYADPADAGKVDQLGKALGVAFPEGAAFSYKRYLLLGEISRRVRVRGDAAQDAAVTQLEGVVP